MGKFVKEVCAVPAPSCNNCNGNLDFQVFENYKNSGISWCQWFCTRGCGNHFTVEIL
ncbi:MAG: hypothetical protein ACTSUE_24575 [Promethearchaeota archaeon]